MNVRVGGGSGKTVDLNDSLIYKDESEPMNVIFKYFNLTIIFSFNINAIKARKLLLSIHLNFYRLFEVPQGHNLKRVLSLFPALKDKTDVGNRS